MFFPRSYYLVDEMSIRLYISCTDFLKYLYYLAFSEDHEFFPLRAVICTPKELYEIRGIQCTYIRLDTRIVTIIPDMSEEPDPNYTSFM
jgi:hypothetical protein